MDVLSTQFISTSFIFFTAGLSFLFAIGQLCGRVRYVENYVLALYLFCLSMMLMQICLIINEIYFTHPKLLFFHFTAMYFLAPIICFADYLVIFPVETMSKKMLVLFIPVLIGVAADVHYIIISDTDKIALFKNMFEGIENPQSHGSRLIIAGAGVQMLLYLGFLLKKMISSRRKEDNNAIFYLLILNIFIVAVLTTLTILGYVIGSFALLRWGTAFAGILVIAAYIISQPYPKILQLLMFEAEKKYYGRSLLEGMDVVALIDELNHQMKVERLYSDDQLTLRDLADELSITPHQLSQLLNDRLNTNFSTFVNQFRISEAKEMLVNEPGKTVLAISLEVGFNSKSAFYAAFSRFTGMSPQAYRRSGGAV